MSRNATKDLTTGSPMKLILGFGIPLLFGMLFQQFYNMVDTMVVGQCLGVTSLAAVGSTGALINLLINVFIGLSVGVNVLVAQYYGAKRDQDVNETVHTAVAISLLSGVFLVALGLLVTRPLLELMGTPDDVIDKSAIYMKIYFAGMPATMLYNFGSAVLKQHLRRRANGARRVDHVVDDQHVAAFDVADGRHLAHDIGLGALLVRNDDRRAEQFRIGVCPLGAAHVGRCDREVFDVEALDVGHEDAAGVELSLIHI